MLWPPPIALVPILPAEIKKGVKEKDSLVTQKKKKKKKRVKNYAEKELLEIKMNKIIIIVLATCTRFENTRSGDRLRPGERFAQISCDNSSTEFCSSDCWDISGSRPMLQPRQLTSLSISTPFSSIQRSSLIILENYSQYSEIQ
jgi:hypothetical protein